MRLHTIPHSTNAERVLLAFGLKGVDAIDVVAHDPGDRSGVRAVSGQELVPVLETGDGRVLCESMDIVAWIDATWPAPALWPADPAARREVDGFIAFFDFVWKVPPNAIDAARRAGAADDDPRVAAWAAQLRAWQHGFDALLAGRDFLFGGTPGAADLCAYPFLKFGVASDADDDDLFHGVLVEHLGAEIDRFAALSAWIQRVARLPRARARTAAANL